MYDIVDGDGDYVHGKRTADVHRLDAEFDLDANRLELGVHGTDRGREFRLDRDREALEAWFSDYFDTPVKLREHQGGAQTDSAVHGQRGGGADARQSGLNTVTILRSGGGTVPTL